jgi:hypothetical protein
MGGAIGSDDTGRGSLRYHARWPAATSSAAPANPEIWPARRRRADRRGRRIPGATTISEKIAIMESHANTTQFFRATTKGTATPSGTAKLAGRHGYRIDGDVAVLNADLAIVSGEATHAHWALQLWACEQPHSGGPLSGKKVAEAPVDLSTAQPGEFQHLHAEAPAHLPADRKGHAMVLVLASGHEGAFEQVHDFANFQDRQPFLVPHFDGAVGYTVDGTSVTLRAERVRSPRAADNLTGSLSVELRALPLTETSVEATGHILASASLGRVMGQAALEDVESRVPFSPPAAGEWRMVLALVARTRPRAPPPSTRSSSPSPIPSPKPTRRPAPSRAARRSRPRPSTSSPWWRA